MHNAWLAGYAEIPDGFRLLLSCPLSKAMSQRPCRQMIADNYEYGPRALTGTTATTGFTTG
eukprot:scaffold395247_cov48-Prasinocladus_malaysianus.AAC.1